MAFQLAINHCHQPYSAQFETNTSDNTEIWDVFFIIITMLLWMEPHPAFSFRQMKLFQLHLQLFMRLQHCAFINDCRIVGIRPSVVTEALL